MTIVVCVAPLVVFQFRDFWWERWPVIKASVHEHSLTRRLIELSLSEDRQQEKSKNSSSNEIQNEW